jgi:hypothetical protein
MLIVCDLETSRMRRPWPALEHSVIGKKYMYSTNNKDRISNYYIYFSLSEKQFPWFQGFCGDYDMCGVNFQKNMLQPHKKNYSFNKSDFH